MIDFPAIENAVHAWIVAATGLPATSVYWEGQSLAQPQRPYATITLRSLQALDSEDARVLPASTVPVPDPPEQLTGMRRVIFGINVYTQSQLGNAGALSLAHKIVDSLMLDSIRAGLDAANIGIGPVSSIILVPSVENKLTPTPRATFDVDLYVVSEATQVREWANTVGVTYNLEN